MRAIVEDLLIHFQNSENGTKNNDEIPDGFYLVGDSENPQKEWSKAILDKVKTITHITAPGLLTPMETSWDSLSHKKENSVSLSTL